MSQTDIQINTQQTDPYFYFTTWSLIVSYSIFIWAVFLGVPRWLFLFAACFLTTTSIVGTFFLTIPSANNIANEFNLTPQQVILEDCLIHSGPLILFLLLFCLIAKRVVSDKPKVVNTGINYKIRGHDLSKFTIRDYHKVILLSIVIIFAYLGYIKFEKVYFYDYFTLVILTAAVFVTSYQIYSRILVV